VSPKTGYRWCCRQQPAGAASDATLCRLIRPEYNVMRMNVVLIKVPTWFHNYVELVTGALYLHGSITLHRSELYSRLQFYYLRFVEMNF
jgi:hypothetical protein